MSDPLSERVKVIKEVTQLFWPERFVHLLAASVSALLIVVVAIITFVRGSDPASVVILAGSGGVLGVSINRVIHMWSKALMLIMEDERGRKH